MKVASTISDMRRERSSLPGPVGFVPTMGFLHDGHLSLVRFARWNNASVVSSIFVNPTQFGPGEDFSAYPRDLARDLDLLEKAGTAVVFNPAPADMYPPDSSTWVQVEKLTDRLEGAARPGHFRGVTTVVAKLFNIVQPDKAYFGQKDAQQALVIKKMVADLNMPVEVVTLPTMREPDGLAMSSRNTYLSPEQRAAATVLYRALMLARNLYEGGERSASRVRQEMTALIRQEPLAEINYISIANGVSLEELGDIKPGALVSLAVRIGRTRLIDNMTLGE